MQSETKEFLLEVGVEEIPASMIEPALADLKRLLVEGFARFRLTGDSPPEVQVYATPRRLVAYCPQLTARQPDSVEQVQGPPKRIAVDADGKPTPAALSFAARMGTKVGKLQTVTTPKGEYLAFQKKERGKPTIELLRALIPEAIQGIGFPRTMYWEAKSGPRFIRPIRSLLALFGGRVIPCSIGYVKASNWTFGHRRLGKDHIKTADFATYREALKANFVLLNAEERKARILDGIGGLLASENGFRLKENPELLHTLVYLTEFPTPLMGSFDPAYLSLPQEVLITVMRGHQKYFSVEQAGGGLAPRFIAVMNLDGDASGAIRHGNERVLRARFNDARFFWEQDGKLRLEERLELLRHVTFQSHLGSYYDKAERMSRLADQIVLMLRHAGAVVSPETHSAIRQAALLAKCDLTTDLVKEFTELQGVIGGLSAEREGLAEEVATSIYDQYKPQSMDDAVPRTLAGAVVALADRMDTLAGCFGVGLQPTGSKDPFALRRAGNGIIRILVEHRLPVTLGGLIQAAAGIYRDAQTQGQAPVWGGHGSLEALRPFFDERLRFYAREVRGFAYDEVNAVLAASPTDVLELFNRLEAVSKIRPTENFEPLAAAFKRIKNILQQAQKASGFTAGALNEAMLEPGPEARLHERYKEVYQEVARHKEAGNYLAALEAIASLRPDVDLFFDKILVMAPQPEVRQNRLTLLQRLLSEFSTIADFSEIVASEEKKM